MFILFLFLSNTAVAQYETLKKAPEDERAIVPGDMKENKEELKVTIRNVDYNIMNFVNNIFMFEDKVKEFVRKICTEEIGSKITAVIEKSKKRGNSGFWGKMVTWHKKYGGMVVPVYAIDIYYNLFKRLTREQQLRGYDTITKSEL